MAFYIFKLVKDAQKLICNFLKFCFKKLALVCTVQGERESWTYFLQNLCWWSISRAGQNDVIQPDCSQTQSFLFPLVHNNLTQFLFIWLLFLLNYCTEVFLLNLCHYNYIMLFSTNSIVWSIFNLSKVVLYTCTLLFYVTSTYSKIRKFYWGRLDKDTL